MAADTKELRGLILDELKRRLVDDCSSVNLAEATNIVESCQEPEDRSGALARLARWVDGQRQHIIDKVGESSPLLPFIAQLRTEIAKELS